MFGGMSTKADRAYRSKMCILPIKVRVRQADGSSIVQIVDVDVRQRAKREGLPSQGEQE